jgi:hypothetical protein
MSRTWLIMPVAIALLLCSGCGNNIRRENMSSARKEIKTTDIVIVRARAAVKAGQNYTGDLAGSVNEQKFSIALFNAGEFVRARNHTLHARRLAYRAIKANNGRISDSEIVDADSLKGSSDASLDADLQKNTPGGNTKDQDAVDTQDTNTQDDLDIKVR